jgi:iron complex outermembrane receptor protein
VGNSDATVTGGEVELFWLPGNDWDIMLGLALNDSEVELVEAGAVPIINAELPNAPNVSANYMVRFTPSLGNGELIAQVDGAYYGDQFLEVTNGSGTVQEAYNVTNMRLGWRNDSWSISVWGKNVFDERYKAYSLDLGVLGATSFYAPPVTYGVTLDAFF